MSRKRSILCILLPVILCAGTVRAQERDDFGIWSQIDLGAKISDKWALRTRGKVAYAIPETRFKPYVSCELFTTDKWEKTRYYLGTTCKLGEHSTLDLFYLYYVMAGVPNQERHVLGLGYAFKI
ncbi:MAG: DUF2490 domain-containing protein [Bacteroidales bacterium]|nr:DUF2490 domain-containing protein [Bacteroidales bacterium]